MVIISKDSLSISKSLLWAIFFHSCFVQTERNKNDSPCGQGNRQKLISKKLQNFSKERIFSQGEFPKGKVGRFESVKQKMRKTN